jgi:alpha-glucosidase (family GH31 glycosyl hydrolase)
VQFGAFQPVLRLHSNHGYRLPWDYPQAPRESAQKFMRLHEALIPYAYSLARQAYDSGLPMARGLYLNYPEYSEAYTYDRQYLYGDDVLVAPVTTPGMSDVATTVWFPPGTWVDYFTGRAYTGPGAATVTTDLSTMPVFLREGGILPTRTDLVDYDAQRPLDQVTLDVAVGGSGEFDLYEDAGDGHGYRAGQFGQTLISYAENASGQGGALAIGAREGEYPGVVPERTWTVKFRNVGPPDAIAINGAPPPDSGWTYDADTRTLTVATSARATNTPTTVTYTAGP